MGRMSAWSRALIACAATLVAFASVLLVAPAGSLTARIVDDVGELLAASLAAWLCARASSKAQSQELPALARAWSWIAAACISWALGQLVWCGYEITLDREVPFPSGADIGFLAFYPMAALGMTAFVRSPSAVTRRLRAPVEALLTGTALSLAAWASFLQPVLRDSPLSAAAYTLSVGYVLGDLVIVALALFALARTPASHRGVLGLICTGVAGLGVSDAAFAYSSAVGTAGGGQVLDTGWLAGFLLLSLAAYRSGSKPVSPVALPPGGALFVPLAAVSLALIATAIGELRGLRIGGIGLGLAGLLLLLLLVLLWSVVLENRGLTHFLQDLVDQRTAELAVQERHFRALTEQGTEVVTLVDPSGRVTYQSPSGQRLHGASVVGMPYVGLVLPDDVSPVALALQEALSDPTGAISVQTRVCGADGTLTYLDTRISNLLGEPSVRALLLSSRDVTERVVLERELEHRATHDSLTGLPHRSVLRQRAGTALSEGPAALLLLDCEGVGDINDGLGREAGDELLRRLAAMIVSAVRPQDTVARLGGDEFAVLVPGAGAREASALAERLRFAVTSPVMLDGTQVVLGVNLGIATTDTVEPDVDQLLRAADLALVAAKADDLPVVVHGPKVQQAQAHRTQLRADLRGAIDGDQLFLQYQPVFDLAEGTLRGVEALVRWRHPEHGVIPPLDFIPLAEQSGQILPLGRWVLETACRAAVGWRERAMLVDGRSFSLSVNLSAKQLRDPGLVSDVRRILSGTGLPAEALVLEITETALLVDLEGACAVLTELRQLGLRVAIDDFGVGYSSLGYLHQLPLDILKVDRSFVVGVTDGGAKALLTRTVLNLAKSLGLWTVAEGIETDGQLAALKAMGCDEAQGYLFARPLDGDRLDALLGQPSPF